MPLRRVPPLPCNTHNASCPQLACKATSHAGGLAYATAVNTTGQALRIAVRKFAAQLCERPAVTYLNVT